ncbi:hypothetical protein C4580_03995 [Candidatus Woesearchaeota archaeon]|nr:MAG: hypothetical protein C4580_03995 [Candidatus Woesearchaeota archaeon]
MKANIFIAYSPSCQGQITKQLAESRDELKRVHRKNDLRAETLLSAVNLVLTPATMDLDVDGATIIPFDFETDLLLTGENIQRSLQDMVSKGEPREVHIWVDEGVPAYQLACFVSNFLKTLRVPNKCTNCEERPVRLLSSAIRRPSVNVLAAIYDFQSKYGRQPTVADVRDHYFQIHEILAKVSDDGKPGKFRNWPNANDRNYANALYAALRALDKGALIVRSVGAKRNKPFIEQISLTDLGKLSLLFSPVIHLLASLRGSDIPTEELLEDAL